MDIAKVVPVTADSSDLKLFEPNLVTGTMGVRVFDVGQGDCIGLLDQNGEVFCYIDYGGLADHPDADNPRETARRMPVEYGDGYVSIVLTHWDKDHYWSANKKNPKAQQCEWLVPRQVVSPQAVFFAAQLKDAKCWPELQGTRVARIGVGDEWDIEIRKCAPFPKKKGYEDRNKTGLAVALLEWVSERVARYILLPGDTPFHQIPNLPTASIYGLVAYHHGARTHWTRKTKPTIAMFHPKRKLAYSHGENEYGHPYRKNYQPDWDSSGSSTADARAIGLRFIDIRWED